MRAIAEAIARTNSLTSSQGCAAATGASGTLEGTGVNAQTCRSDSLIIPLPTLTR